MTEKQTTGMMMADSLVAHGVDTIFGIAGAHMYDFNDALYGVRHRLRFVHTRHEQGAGYMAYGYAKSTGKVGVYTVVPGPGVLNSGAALCTAYGANAPVLCVTGNVMSDLIGRGRGQLHELPDQLGLLRGLTKSAERINHPSEVSTVMARAFTRMTSGRQGPASVEAPWDVFGQKAVPTTLEIGQAEPAPIADPDAIDAAVALIKAARRPLIMVGGGAVEASTEISELARLLQAPATAHRSGKGILADDDPYALNMVAAFEYWKDVDLLIGIGSRLELQHMRWRWLPAGLKTIRIDIDPIEFVRLKPTVSVVADAAAGTRALIDALHDFGAQDDRRDELAGLRTRAAATLEGLQPQISYLQAIRDVLPRDGFLVEEVSQMGFSARLGFPVYQPRSYVTCGYQDNLGFGYDTALGVKVANPDKAVVSITGDGGFLFGMQEMATAIHHGINVVVIVFNNNSYGNVLRDQRMNYQGRTISAELTNPDFVKLGESFGMSSMRAASPPELRKMLARALEMDAPCLIEVPVERGSERSPWPFIHPAPPAI